MYIHMHVIHIHIFIHICTCVYIYAYNYIEDTNFTPHKHRLQANLHTAQRIRDGRSL